MRRWVRWRLLRPQVGDYWTNGGTTFDRARWNRDMWYWRNMRPDYNPWPVICGIVISVAAILAWIA